MEFSSLQQKVARQFAALSGGRLYRTTVEPDALWERYLGSFPPGSNPVYKTRTEHDCGACKHFVRNIGGVVGVVAGEPATLWDFEAEGPFGVVAKSLADFVRRHAIKEPYLHPGPLVGVASSRELLADKSVKTWEHFHVRLPAACVSKGVLIGPALNESRTTYEVLKRSLAEIKLEDIDAVLELIDQNSLYRGEEQRFVLTEFRKIAVQYSKTRTHKDLFIWESAASTAASVARIRNTVIGTLLTDLAEGKDLDVAVASFESKVAPANYKRPTALVTKAMIQQAQKKVDELGLGPSLERRYATIDDLTINNILFADRAVRRGLTGGNIFEDLAASASTDVKKFDKVEEVSIEDFIAKILPKATSLEVLFENQHTGNLVSLIAPADPTAKLLFKWPNGFSWSYTGDLADSIKERVKAAGGSVTGDFRGSLSWFNHDDLDLHLSLPGGREVYYGNKLDLSSGTNLDVDMNAGSGKTRTPVENIAVQSRNKLNPGMYRLYVHNFSRRETTNVGFEAEIEFDGTVYSFSYPKAVKDQEKIDVCTFEYSRQGGFKIIKSLPAAQQSRVVWGLSTQAFHKVKLVSLSPNYWDSSGVGNKHFLFLLDKCVNDGKARGFFNEFLRDDLSPHRKVLEIVGSRMRTDETSEQLSGLGFSSTQKASVVCKVTGAFTRTVKVVF